MTTRTYRALLVANSTFPADAHNLPELEGPRNDPALLRDALCDRDAGLVPSDNVRMVTERTMAEVLREVEDFLRAATRQDTLILYYSGHGLLDQSNELFLCTRDTRSDRLRSTAVKASDLRHMIDESAAATTVILLDCCYSGRFKGGDLPAVLAGRGRFVVTSSRGGELANDTNVRNHASLFTHHVVEGLLHGAVDRDDDGIVNLSELYDYVHTAMTESGRQVPQKRFEGDGDVPMALRTMSSSANPQPGLLDPLLVQPVLDVPDSVIDLGDVGADEELPPERIAVINRGGGNLEWTVQSSDPWVRAVADEGSVMLHLAPRPGPNRANIYITDSTTGAIKTVRVSVRVREASGAAPHKTQRPAPVAARQADLVPPPEEFLGAPVTAASLGPADEPPQPPPETDLGVTPLPETSPWARIQPALARWMPLAAAALAALSGLLIVTSSLQTYNAVLEYTGGTEVMLRTDGGPGLLPVLLAGAALGLAGLVGLVPRLRLPALGLALAVAVPTAFARLVENVSTTSTCQCSGPDDGVVMFRGSALMALLAASVCVAALGVCRQWHRASWLSRPVVAVGAVAAAVWGWTTLSSLYRHFEDVYGTYTQNGGTGWQTLVVISTIVGVVAASYLAPPVGAATLVGASILPLASVVHEGISIGQVVAEDGFSVWRMLPAFVAVTVMLAVAGHAIRRARATQEFGGRQ